MLGKIPADRLYQTGLNILKQYPLPNPSGAGIAYNYEVTPAEREHPQLAAGGPRRLSADAEAARDRSSIRAGSSAATSCSVLLPGFNDTQMQRPVISNLVFSANYNLNNTTFIEGTYGRSRNELAGCALAQTGTGPNFCRAAIPMNDDSYRSNVGSAACRCSSPTRTSSTRTTTRAQALDKMNPAPPAWVNGDFIKPPAFSWGSRVSPAPPNIPFPSYFNVNATQDVSISLTKVMGRHTHEGRLLQHPQLQGRTGDRHRLVRHDRLRPGHVAPTPSTRPSVRQRRHRRRSASFNQAQNYVEGNFVYDNREAYVQDNWKVNNRLTLDYGMRFVHATPQYDKLGQGSNFLPDKWALGNAPQLYRPGCAFADARRPAARRRTSRR